MLLIWWQCYVVAQVWCKVCLLVLINYAFINLVCSEALVCLRPIDRDLIAAGNEYGWCWRQGNWNLHLHLMYISIIMCALVVSLLWLLLVIQSSVSQKSEHLICRLHFHISVFFIFYFYVKFIFPDVPHPCIEIRNTTHSHMHVFNGQCPSRVVLSPASKDHPCFILVIFGNIRMVEHKEICFIISRITHVWYNYCISKCITISLSLQ